MNDEKVRLPRDERRATLLAAALEVFTAAGYHAAAMDEIAEQAGVSKPVLYQHFPSKLDLYLAVLDIHCEYLVEDIRAAVASTKDNAGRVLATVNAYFDFINREGEAFRLLFESDMAVEPQVRERLNKMSYDCATAFSDAITADTGRTYRNRADNRSPLARPRRQNRPRPCCETCCKFAMARYFRFPQNLITTKLREWPKKIRKTKPRFELGLAIPLKSCISRPQLTPRRSLQRRMRQLITIKLFKSKTSKTELP